MDTGQGWPSLERPLWPSEREAVPLPSGQATGPGDVPGPGVASATEFTRPPATCSAWWGATPRSVIAVTAGLCPDAGDKPNVAR
jgi:hypothetical protein